MYNARLSELVRREVRRECGRSVGGIDQSIQTKFSMKRHKTSYNRLQARKQSKGEDLTPHHEIIKGQQRECGTLVAVLLWICTDQKSIPVHIASVQRRRLELQGENLRWGE